MEKKRKTHTSTAVKRRYNEKTYKSVRANLRKELVEEWEKALIEDEIAKAEFLRNSIKQYLNNRKNNYPKF